MTLVDRDDFARALLDPARPCPAGLVGPDGLPSTRRFAVHRNNVVHGLVEVLAAAYPVTRRIVGAPFFDAMARVHVANDPPRSPILADYGDGFPAFVGRFPPAAGLPWLRDVARLERAWREAYHAADAVPVRALDTVPPERWTTARLVLHPSLRVVRSRHPIATIWRMNVDGASPRALGADDVAESVLVVRPDADVAVRVVPRRVARFVDALARRPLLDVVRQARWIDDLSTVGTIVDGLLAMGAVTGVVAGAAAEADG